MHTILNVKARKTRKELRQFIGIVNYYHDMRFCRGELLDPWTSLTSVLSWYHEYLLHPGQTRTEKTIRNTMTWPGLKQDVEHALFMFHLSNISNDKEVE
jgi:hypothetical protein